jgi:hypothetical protein
MWALLLGLGFQVALALVPASLGTGPRNSSLPGLRPTLDQAWGIWSANLVVLGIFVVVAVGSTVLAAETHARRGGMTPATRIAAYGGILAAFYLAYFLPGVAYTASYYHVGRPRLLGCLVHGYLELPAFALPFTAASIALARRRRGWTAALAGAAVSVFVLAGAAVLEAEVTSDLLSRLTH